jgi:hypothetical protein
MKIVTIKKQKTNKSEIFSEKLEDAVMKKTFLVLYRPGPSWIEGKSIYEQPLEAHGG